MTDYPHVTTADIVGALRLLGGGPVPTAEVAAAGASQADLDQLIDSGVLVRQGHLLLLAVIPDDHAKVTPRHAALAATLVRRVTPARFWANPSTSIDLANALSIDRLVVELSVAVRRSSTSDGLAEALLGLTDWATEVGRYRTVADALMRLSAGQLGLGTQVASDLARQLAIVLARLGRFSEAERPLNEALNLREVEVGGGGLEARLRDALVAVDVYGAQGRSALARSWRQEADRLLDAGAHAGELVVSAHGELGWAYLQANELDSAVRHFALQREASAECYGPEARAPLLDGMYGSATLARGDGRLSEGAALMAEAVDVAESELGVDHPFYGVLLSGYADFLGELGEASEQVRAIERTIANADNQETNYRASWIRHAKLAQVLEGSGDLQKALAERRHALAAGVNAHGRHAFQVAREHAAIGRLLQQLANPVVAAKHLEQALAIVEGEDGDGHEGQQLRATLVGIYVSLGNTDLALRHGAQFLEAPDSEAGQRVTVRLLLASSLASDPRDQTRELLNIDERAEWQSGPPWDDTDGLAALVNDAIAVRNVDLALFSCDVSLRLARPELAQWGLQTTEAEVASRGAHEQLAGMWQQLGRWYLREGLGHEAVLAAQRALGIAKAHVSTELLQVLMLDVADAFATVDLPAYDTQEAYRSAINLDGGALSTSETGALSALGLCQSLDASSDQEGAVALLTDLIGRSRVTTSVAHAMMHDELARRIDDAQESCRLWRKALEIVQDDEPQFSASVLLALGRLLTIEGRYDEAWHAFEERLRILSRDGVPDPFAEAVTLHDLSDVSYGRGDYRSAERLLRIAARYKRMAPGARDLSTTLARLGAVRLESGDLAGAEEALHECVALEDPTGDDVWSRASAWQSLVGVQRARGDAQGATDAARLGAEAIFQLDRESAAELLIEQALWLGAKPGSQSTVDTLLREAQDRLGGYPAASPVRSAMAYAARYLAASGEPASWAFFISASLSLEEAWRDDPKTSAPIVAALARMAVGAGHVEAASRLRSRAAGWRMPTPADEWRATLSVLFAHLAAGRLDDADQALLAARQLGAPPAPAARAGLLLAQQLSHAGRLSDAARVHELTLMFTGAASPSLDDVTAAVLGEAADLRLATGDLAESARLLQRALQLEADVETRVVRRVALGRIYRRSAELELAEATFRQALLDIEESASASTAGELATVTRDLGLTLRDRDLEKSAAEVFLEAKTHAAAAAIWRLHAAIDLDLVGLERRSKERARVLLDDAHASLLKANRSLPVSTWTVGIDEKYEAVLEGQSFNLMDPAVVAPPVSDHILRTAGRGPTGSSPHALGEVFGLAHFVVNPSERERMSDEAPMPRTHETKGTDWAALARVQSSIARKDLTKAAAALRTRRMTERGSVVAHAMWSAYAALAGVRDMPPGGVDWPGMKARLRGDFNGLLAVARAAGFAGAAEVALDLIDAAERQGATERDHTMVGLTVFELGLAAEHWRDDPTHLYRRSRELLATMSDVVQNIPVVVEADYRHHRGDHDSHQVRAQSAFSCAPASKLELIAATWTRLAGWEVRARGLWQAQPALLHARSLFHRVIPMSCEGSSAAHLESGVWSTAAESLHDQLVAESVAASLMGWRGGLPLDESLLGTAHFAAVEELRAHGLVAISSGFDWVDLVPQE